MDLSNLAVTEARELYEALPNLAFTREISWKTNRATFRPGFRAHSFGAIDPERRDEYANPLNRWLQPGGLFSCHSFLYSAQEQDGPPFGTDLDEIVNLFLLFELIEQWTPRHFEGRRRRN